MTETLSFEKAKARIQEYYVDRVLNFLISTERQACVSSAEFQLLYKLFMDQCDNSDNGKHFYTFYKDITRKYLFEVVVPHVRG